VKAEARRVCKTVLGLDGARLIDPPVMKCDARIAELAAHLLEDENFLYSPPDEEVSRYRFPHSSIILDHTRADVLCSLVIVLRNSSLLSSTAN
jgi:hypothetical protein